MALTVALRGDAVLADMLATDAVGDAASDSGRGRTDGDGHVVASDTETAADLLLAVGDDAVRTLADDPAPVPVLPVDAGVGRHGLSSPHVDDALRAFAADPGTLTACIASHPVLTVSVGGFEARAVLDVALVTSEAARISEYTVAARAEPLASFRADGVVVATPAGSAGYAHAAGGPVLAATGVVTVVPVSPYTTRPSTWVVDPPVTLGVVRDEAAVSLVVDGELHRRVGVDRPVRVDVAGTVDLVRPPRPPDGARRLEKL
jgi:NAD+ kinase